MGNVVVTGATKGIGLALVERFAKEGHNVAFCSRNNQDLQRLASKLEAEFGVNTYYEQCDMSSTDDVQMFGEHVVQEMGEIDVLINNAGIFLPGDISSEEEGSFELLMTTNVYSAYHLTRSILPGMMKRNRGHIFNMCSTASIMALPNGGSYSISKFALLGMTKVLRKELLETNIKVTAILPGPTFSASWEGVDIPKERFMMASEVADMVYATYGLPGNAVVEELLMRPQKGDI